VTDRSTGREAFLTAAPTLGPLLRSAEVAAAWDRPSALEAFSVRGLAGHLASQALMVGDALAAPDSELGVIPLSEHYARVAWIDAPVDSDVNTLIRAGGERAAADGPNALADRVEAAVKAARPGLRDAPPDRRVTAPSGQWALSLDDFALTRAMEIAVHSDDLAVSVGLGTPVLPDEPMAAVLGLLVDIAVSRHGQTAVLRALSRRERAPASITAF
jgi:hypothetical protein